MPRSYEGTSCQVLSEITSAQINMVIWHRSVPKAFAEFQASRKLGPELRCNFLIHSLTPMNFIEDQLHAARVGLREAPHSLDSSMIKWLAMDLQKLIGVFASLCSSRKFRVRIDQDLRRSCSLFHVDYVPLRMLCVYAGPGTEWLDEESADREALGTDNEQILRPDAPVRALREGDVAILKGEKYPGNGGRGLIHRSPDFRVSQARILIAIDPIA
jgi:hypothetical protein